MATAAIASRRVVKLENDLGDGRDYKQVKAIHWAKEIFVVTEKGFWSQFGKWLKKFCKERGFSYRNIESAEFGTVHAFHIDAISAAREYIMGCPDALARYRKTVVA